MPPYVNLTGELDQELGKLQTRRQFFARSRSGIGVIALASLLNEKLSAKPQPRIATLGALDHLHLAPKAKRVIYMFQSGAPSHIDLYDPKPKLKEVHGEELPESVRRGQRLTGMTSRQKSFPMVGATHGFLRHPKTGMEVAEILPNIHRISEDIALVRSMHTEPINHDPAVTFINTGHQQPGRPSMGAWLSYGLGSENSDMPGFVVLLSGSGGQPLQARYWGTGFLPGKFQGVQFRSAGDPVLFVHNPPGIDRKSRRQLLDAVRELNQIQLDAFGDPEILTRINAYEMAYRMQTSVPDLTDISQEPQSVLEKYGAEPGKPGLFANNALLARRLVERGVRFVQLYHRDWDHHGNLPAEIRRQAKNTDQAAAALVEDLKERGLLDDTLVVWGGEFGRTTYSQGKITKDSFGRDHHPRCFSIWLAGGGIKGGITYGQTDDFGYNIEKDPVHVHDLHATLLHCLGIDHTALTFRFQGRDHRLTDVSGEVVEALLA